MLKPWEAAYEARFKGSAFGNDAIGLFTLGLFYNIEDLDTLGAEVITGGGDDKKCDLFYLDAEDSRAVIAQCYISQNTSKPSAPSNKASDLGVAVNWLLNSNLENVTEPFKSNAIELRDAIGEGKIKEFLIWYVHNLPESSNVKKELETVQASAVRSVRQYTTDHINIQTQEIGTNTLSTLFTESRAPILVSDDVAFKAAQSFEVITDKWSALVTTISGKVLRQIFLDHKEKLFSANVRDYLGSRSSDSNINNGIKETATNSPQDFWAFNNGVTALVNTYEYKKKRSHVDITISGLSIVNGAQTTGALGSLLNSPDDQLLVPIRLIKTKEETLIYDIIKYNNSQNKVTASDMRSNDNVQRRLKQEFIRFPGCDYEAGRRGGASDAIRRRPSLLPSYTVGQALAAFHDEPVVAYDQKSEIWVNDAIYSRVFNQRTSASHIIFVFSLLKRSLELKTNLVSKQKIDVVSLTASDKNIILFFTKKGSVHLLMAAIANCMEIICQRPVPDRFAVSFKNVSSVVDGEKIWDPILNVVLPLVGQLDDAFVANRIRNDKVSGAISRFCGVVGAVAVPNKTVFGDFKQRILFETP